MKEKPRNPIRGNLHTFLKNTTHYKEHSTLFDKYEVYW